MTARLTLQAAGSLVEVEAPLKLLSSPAGKRVLIQGLREGGDKTRTKVRRALKDQMGVLRYATIVKSTWGGLGAGFETPTYLIRGDGKGLPITEFPVRREN